MHKSTETVLEPLAVQIPVACKLLGCGKTTAYQLIKDGELVRVKIGTRTAVTMESIKRYFADLLAQS